MSRLFNRLLASARRPAERIDRERRWSAPRALLGHLGAGALLGLSRQAAWLWPLAVLSGVLWAFAIARTPRRAALVVGVVASQLLSHALWLRWSFAMSDVFFSGRPSLARWLALGFIAIEMLPTTATLVSFGALFWQRLPVRVWFPIAWTVGELLQWRLSNITIEWLAIFQDVEPVLRSVGRFGLVPSLLAFLFILTSAGEALAERRRVVAVPAAGLLALLVALPAPPEADRSVLERIGVVHMANELSYPALDGLDVDLAVWPESSFVTRPLIGEGSASHARFRRRSADRVRPTSSASSPTKGTRSTPPSRSSLPARLRTCAKQVLFPVVERRHSASARSSFSREKPLLLRVAGRNVIPLVCFEFMARHPSRAGARRGHRRPLERALPGLHRARREPGSSLAVLRAAEFHLPIVCSSIEGHGWIISAEGRVLAEGDRYTSGTHVDGARGAVDHLPRPPAGDRRLLARHPRARLDCPPGHVSTSRSRRCAATGGNVKPSSCRGTASRRRTSSTIPRRSRRRSHA